MSALDTLAAQVPQELRTKLMQHFGIAKEYEKSSETISITYYCLMYIANEALKLQKEKAFVSSVLDYLESTKRSHPQDEIIKSMATGQAVIEELITDLVSEANTMDDEDEKTAEHLRLLMRKNYTVGGLTDVLAVFGPVKDDFATLGKLAKSRAVAIFRDLKAGAGAPSATRPPESNAPAIPPAAAAQLPPAPSYASAASHFDQGSASASVPYDVISKAQKLCRYANSSLEHEDVNTAIHNCEQALELLRPYRKN